MIRSEALRSQRDWCLVECLGARGPKALGFSPVDCIFLIHSSDSNAT
jgi:hypothetical protein